MAAYFHGSGSEIQSSADGLQTLYLMHPNRCVSYTDNTYHSAAAAALPNPNMFFHNHTVPGNALNLSNLSHAPPPPPHQQPLLGITLPANNMVGSSNSDEPGRSSLPSHYEISGPSSNPQVQYHLWGPVTDQRVSSTLNSSPQTTGTMDVASHQLGFRRPNQQGLSLSLSSQQTSLMSLSGEINVTGHGRQFQALSSADGGGGRSQEIEVPGNCCSSLSNGIADMQNVILGSKYLKAAQELLDEVVNVGKAVKVETEEGRLKEKMKLDNEEAEGGAGAATTENNSSSKQGAELSTGQRQELQMKKTKLINMLDEVEQRYRQYRQQIQIVVSSFGQAAGLGAAKSYTSLALKTISKQFRCLKDAISSQIKATSKNLGEDHCLGAKLEGSRLRYVDHHLRQQRAMQQLGMIHHNAWRPQRGLPERAVSVLRAWLFEHFLHPYPKDSDKVLLAKQTGLTRSQVSNWFINARVRLWKPMVEEMYMEETKEQEHKNSGDNSSCSRLKDSDHKELVSMPSTTAQISDAGVGQEDQRTPMPQSSKSEMFQQNQKVSTADQMSMPSMSTSPSAAAGGYLQSQSGFNLLRYGDMQSSPHKTRNKNSEMMHNSPSSILSVSPGPGEQTDNPDHHSCHIPFEAFSMGMGDIGRFNSHELTPRFHGNGVSLTLGLPHTHSDQNLSLSGNQHGIAGYLPFQSMQLGRLVEIGTSGNEFCAINTPQTSYSNTGFDNIDHVQNRKGFAAQLLPDFVAR